MSHSTKLALFSISIFILRAFGNPQFNIPSSIEDQLYSILPTQIRSATELGYIYSYFSANPAAYTTLENKVSSIVAANPSLIPTGDDSLFSANLGPSSLPDLGLSPTETAEIQSLASAFSAAITGNPYPISYASQYYSSYIAAASSILGTDFPTIASYSSGYGGGYGGGAGLPTRPIFTMATSTSIQGGTPLSQATSGTSRVTSQATVLTTQQQTTITTSETLAAVTGNKAPMQTPALALGLSGAAVAAVAGLAALL